MEIYDVSMDIHQNMMVYKNKEENKPEITVKTDHSNSRTYESSIRMGMHTGTHIDAPLHMLKDGQTMENYSIENFVKKCKVLDLTYVENKITKNILQEKNIEKGDFLLFKTKNSFTEVFDFEFIYLEESGAKHLEEIGIAGVGIDSLGIEREQPQYETHRTLLGKNIMIIEGLQLKEIEEGEYTLIALPLKIKNVEASPARVILIKE
ncbi:cyclase family protein [Clostridium formicaceticum]|uniref:Kynurenine formamidase n=1 Tax=Clostridium formicaceticum TaxID=1497 RepID=A0AAC9WGQ1_9CLOT|nr:cyclase family protein [Clostridium formicaceticum]AOY77486.1 cyclase [Clostridium formicaceticum]ARE88049.1 Kynurenine formamidase [Clostridium formicaceticum]